MKKLCLPLLVALLALGASPQPAAAIEGIWSGSCALTGTVSFSPAAQLSLQQTNVTVDLEGPCVLNTGLATMYLDGSLGTNPAMPGMGCAAGHAAGLADVEITTPGFGLHTADVTMVNTGGELVLVVTVGLNRFDGVAVLTPLVSAAACGGGAGISTGDYTGPMVFQDPDLSKILP